jgi:hypothetical protein
MKKYIEKKGKEVFHLPVQQGVYVPSTKEKNKPVSAKEYKARVKEVKKFLSNKFGGYTKVKGTGGYHDSKKGLIEEKVAVVYSYAENSKFRKNKGVLVTQLGKWRNKWGQDSMGYEHEGDMYYIGGKKAPKTRKVSPATRKKLLKNLIKARQVRANKLRRKK